MYIPLGKKATFFFENREMLKNVEVITSPDNQLGYWEARDSDGNKYIIASFSFVKIHSAQES